MEGLGLDNDRAKGGGGAQGENRGEVEGYPAPKIDPVHHILAHVVPLGLAHGHHGNIRGSDPD